MCTSVPQIAFLWILIFTSFGPTSGIGTLFIQSPCSGFSFTSAHIILSFMFSTSVLEIFPLTVTYIIRKISRIFNTFFRVLRTFYKFMFLCHAHKQTFFTEEHIYAQSTNPIPYFYIFLPNTLQQFAQTSYFCLCTAYTAHSNIPSILSLTDFTFPGSVPPEPIPITISSFITIDGK